MCKSYTFGLPQLLAQLWPRLACCQLSVSGFVFLRKTAADLAVVAASPNHIGWAEAR